MQRIIDLLNRCRTRPVHQVDAPLLRDEDKYKPEDEKKPDGKKEVKETKGVAIRVDDPIADFKANQAELKRCLALFKNQKRKARACFLTPGFISGVSATILGGVILYYKNKILSNYSTAYNAFSHTRTNCTYIDYNLGEVGKNFSNILCPDIHYPFVMKGYDIYYNQFCRFNDRMSYYCCYFDKLYLQNTTGLEVCTQLLSPLCHAYYEKHDYDNLNFLNVLGWFVVAAALIYFIGNNIYYKYRESSVIDNSRFKVSNDANDIDMLYQVAQRHHIFHGERNDFVSELRFHPTRLHSAYQEMLRRLENNHIKFLTRFTFLQGLSRCERVRNIAPMRVLGEAKHNFISIFEYADVSINKDFSARKAFLSAAYDKNNDEKPVHQFFKSIKEEKDSDDNEIYEKDEMMNAIFRFAGI